MKPLPTNKTDKTKAEGLEAWDRKSDLGKALANAIIQEESDASLVIHFIAGAQESREIETALAILEARRAECEKIAREIAQELRERYPRGKHFAAHGSLLSIASHDASTVATSVEAGPITTAPIEVLP